MPYHFRNLVFEGGGVKGIAYIGALQVLEEKGISQNIVRVGGTSVGAINATMVALGLTIDEQKDILWNLNFKNFMDNSWGIFRNINRVINHYGWNKGDFCKEWIGGLIARRLKNPKATFKDLKAAGKLDLYVYGTNLSTHYGEVYSIEHTPDMSIAEAVRISMSIPMFFAAIRNERREVFVDGGCLNNYPVKLFDREKYLKGENLEIMGFKPNYYKAQNEEFLNKHHGSSPYIYNKQTLGFRLDSLEEIVTFRHSEPPGKPIKNFPDYVKALVKTIMDSQNNAHLHNDDWHRTIYINSLDVSATQFTIDEKKKNDLLQSGIKGATDYFDWFDKSSEPKNKP